MSDNAMRSEFAVYVLNDSGKVKARKIALAFSALAEALDESCDLKTDGRSRSIVLTKLEEACFFAKRSMATNLNNQELP